MKILITGCRGQLGTELQKQLAAESCVLGPLPERLRKATIIPVDVDELDITDREATINYIRRHQPETVINCAAFTNVDGCEISRDAAYKVNALGPRNLALACEKVNAQPDPYFHGLCVPRCRQRRHRPGRVRRARAYLGLRPDQAAGRAVCASGSAAAISSCAPPGCTATTGKNFVKTMVRLGKTHDEHHRCQ